MISGMTMASGRSSGLDVAVGFGNVLAWVEAQAVSSKTSNVTHIFEQVGFKVNRPHQQVPELLG